MRKLSILLSLVMTISLFTGCNNTNNKTPDNPDEVKIGINYELTGEVATYGIASSNGIKMAFDEINANGGINGMKIVPVEMDNKSAADEATSVATKMMTREGVVAELGPATSGNFMATIPVAMQNKVPILSGSATADEGVTVDSSGTVNDYVFRLCFNDSLQGITMAKFAIDELNAKNAVIINDTSSDYAKGLTENFKKTFEEKGGKIVAIEGYVEKDKDFNSILTKINSQDFDVIFIPGYYQEAGLIIKQARDLGIDTPILGADGFDSPVLLQLAGEEALNNIYFSNHYSAAEESEIVQKFTTGYKEKYNEEPNAFNALGYDMGYFIADAIERAGSKDPEKIKDALASTKGFVGVTGTIDMGENHNPIKDILVIGLEDGVQATSVKIDPNK